MRLSLAFALTALSIGCGGAQGEAGAEPADVEVTAEAAPSPSSWRERFHRRAPASASKPSTRIAIGVISTEAATSSTKADKERAKKLYMEGKTLMEAGHFDEACPKIAEAHAAVPGAIALLRLSECLEQGGDLEGACEVQCAAIVMLERTDVGDRRKGAKERLAKLACP